MESQPQNPEFRNNPENVHLWYYKETERALMPLYIACFNDEYNLTPGITVCKSTALFFVS